MKKGYERIPTLPNERKISDHLNGHPSSSSDNPSNRNKNLLFNKIIILCLSLFLFLLLYNLIIQFFSSSSSRTFFSSSTSSSFRNKNNQLIFQESLNNLNSFDLNGRYLVKKYDKQSPFSSFLPGISGLWGIPMYYSYSYLPSSNSFSSLTNSASSSSSNISLKSFLI